MTEENADYYSDEVATFGDRLAGAREAAGLDQAGLAKRLGIRLSTLKDWEDDLSEPRANKLSMLSGVLNVSMRWLLMGEGDDLGGAHLRADVTLADLADLRGDLESALAKLARLEARLRDDAAPKTEADL